MAPRGGVDYASAIKAPAGPYGSSAYKGLSRWAEYGQSKWGCIALARWLNWHHGPQQAAATGSPEIISVALHPGKAVVFPLTAY